MLPLEIKRKVYAEVYVQDEMGLVIEKVNTLQEIAVTESIPQNINDIKVESLSYVSQEITKWKIEFKTDIHANIGDIIHFQLPFGMNQSS